MSLKAEIETWAAALQAYDEEDFEKALELFGSIADTSKILTNMGLIYATMGEHEIAVEQFNAATSLDQYLAVAYFQCGVSNFLLRRYDRSLRDFEEALLYLRGNQAINYEQLGLKFRLYSAEVLFNRGLSQIYMGQVEQGLQDMKEAQLEKATPEHNVIEEAIQDKGDGYTVFSIPVGVLYRPSEAKLKNAKTKDYLGKARLIAASDADDAYTTFTGVTLLQRGLGPTGTRIETPTAEPLQPSNLTRSATVPPAVTQRKYTLSDGPTIEEGKPTGRITRSNTTAASGTGVKETLPTRGLSIRRAGEAPTPPAKPQPKQPLLTEIYDNYMDGNEEEPAPPRNQSTKMSPRMSAWSRSTPSARSPPSRSPTQYAPSSVGSMRRKPSRRRPTRRSFEEEEEGYGSGEYDDTPLELSKIRVKLHYKDDIRGMTLTPDVPFEEFMERVTQKFGKALQIKFQDEDGGKISLTDESDYELAIETAREIAKGRSEGKIEMWCVEK